MLTIHLENSSCRLPHPLSWTRSAQTASWSFVRYSNSPSMRQRPYSWFSAGISRERIEVEMDGRSVVLKVDDLKKHGQFFGRGSFGSVIKVEVNGDPRSAVAAKVGLVYLTGVSHRLVFCCSVSWSLPTMSKSAKNYAKRLQQCKQSPTMDDVLTLSFTTVYYWIQWAEHVRFARISNDFVSVCRRTMLVVETDGQQSSQGLSKVTSDDTVWQAQVERVVAEGGVQCESSLLHSTSAHIIDVFDTIQVVSALKFMSGHGLSHNDVKPENILLDRQGNLVLADFGESDDINDGTVPHTNRPGTPYYWPPEYTQQQRMCSSERSNLYALGLTLVEMCLGRHPYPMYMDGFTLDGHIQSWRPSLPLDKVSKESDQFILDL